MGHPHIQQTRQGGRCIIGMQGGKHHMTGLCRLDGNVSRFEIPDFTHHDDIRILPQKRLQGRREGQTGLLIDVNLINARQIDFNRIFCR
jgi:hypothetical protein